MNARRLLPLTAALALAGSCAKATRWSGEELPPSVVIVSLDTLRQDHVGLYGYERDTTPFLDELAAECLVFENAYTTMSWTLIAHMSLLTGLYPSQHRVWDKASALPYSIPTLAERLSESGYHTIGFYYGPESWLHPRYGYGRGFDVYQHHENAEVAERNIRAALAAAPKNRPVFLFVHLFDIHSAPIHRKRRGETIYEPPAPFDSCFVEGAPQRLEGIDAWALWNEDGSGLDAAQHEALVALYDGGIRYIDDKLRAWTAEWRELGFFDDALTVITSDHGEGLYERGGRWGGHGGTTEEGLRIPLLVRLPRGELGGQRIAAPVSLVDVVPTVLRCVGLDLDQRLVGHDLTAPIPDERLIYAERDGLEAVLFGKWKLIRNKAAKWGRLIDLESDPREWRPLVSKRDPEAFEQAAEPVSTAIERDRAGWFFPAEPNPHAGELSEDALEALQAGGYAGEVEDEEEPEEPDDDEGGA